MDSSCDAKRIAHGLSICCAPGAGAGTRTNASSVPVKAMNDVHRSIGFSAISKYGSTVFQVLCMAALARLLTPAEFGIYTTIYAFIVIANVTSREFGGANYLIQKANLAIDDVRTAFTISAMMAAVLAAALVAMSGVVASFYSEDGVRLGIAIAALSFLLSPFVGTTSALLRRDMEFDVLAGCTLASNFVTAGTSVVLAAVGQSYMSPIWGAIAGQFVLAGLLIKFRPSVWIFLPCLKGWREVVDFGLFSGAVAIINVIYQVLPQLIIGRMLDFTAAGLYGRAVTVTQIFDRLVLEVLGPVIMPAFAARTRAGHDLKPAYLRAVELLTAVQWPFLIFTALMAEPIVQILLGPGWADTVPLIRILCVASLALFAACLTYPVLVTIGRVRDTLTASLISVLPSLAIIFAASFFGLTLLAASALVTLPLQAAVAIYFVGCRLGIRAGDLFGAMVKSAIVVALSGAGAMVMTTAEPSGSTVPVVRLAAAASGALAGWCIGLVATQHPLLGHIRVLSKDMISAAGRLGRGWR